MKNIYNLLSLCLLVSLWFFSTGFALQISFSRSPTSTDLTQSFSVLCNASYNDHNKLTTFLSIAVQKYSNHSWTTIAEVHKNANTQKYPEVKVEGILDSVNSYIRVTWPNVRTSSPGHYRCNLVGFDRNMNVLTFHTEGNMTLVGRMYTLKQLQNGGNANDVLLKHVDAHYLEIIKHLLKIEAQNRTQSSSLSCTDQWPVGFATLIKPNSGCPDECHTEEGEIEFNTDNGGSDSTTTSNNNHMSTPVQDISTRNNTQHAYLRFCAVGSSGLSESRITNNWPQGTYCITPARFYTSCPFGFSKGSVRIDDEDIRYDGHHIGLTPSYFDGDYSNITFCCRNDSSYSNPIILPRSKPFYLWRFGGSCQQVYRMNAANEYLELDVSGSRRGRCYGPYPTNLCDTFPIRFSLCYYSPVP